MEKSNKMLVYKYKNQSQDTTRKHVQESVTQELKGINPTQIERLEGAYQVPINITTRWAI